MGFRALPKDDVQSSGDLLQVRGAEDGVLIDERDARSPPFRSGMRLSRSGHKLGRIEDEPTRYGAEVLTGSDACGDLSL